MSTQPLVVAMVERIMADAERKARQHAALEEVHRRAKDRETQHQPQTDAEPH